MTVRNTAISAWARRMAPVLLLAAFQVTFVLLALRQCGGTVRYLGRDASAEVAHTLEAAIAAPFWRFMLALIATELLAGCLCVWQKLDYLFQILVPTGVLLTVGAVYQTVVTSPAASARHYRFILLGLCAALLGIVLARLPNRLSEKKLVHYLWFLLAGMTVYTLAATLWGARHTVNGSGGYFLGTTPGEVYKVFAILFLSLGLVPMRLFPRMRRCFLGLTAFQTASLVMLHSLGDAAVMLLLMVLVVYILYGWRYFAVSAASLALLAVLGYFALTALQPDNYIAARFADTLTATTDPTANANLRTSLIGVLYRGVFGSGTGDLRIVSYNFASETDYVFSGVTSIFGAAGGLLVAASYAALGRGLCLPAKTCRDDAALYNFSSLVATLVLTQSAVHIGCNLNLLPLTGICLPLVSSGGSSMMTTMFAIGLAAGRRIQLCRPIALPKIHLRKKAVL